MLIDFYKKYKYELIVGGAVLVLLVLWLFFRNGSSGTYSTSYWYSEGSGGKQKSSSKQPPKISRGESKCKEVLEKIFGKPFSSVRPNHLNNPVTKQNLELDCYNDELRLGCEYSGIQHYKYTPYFHKNYEAFRNQQYRDYMKQQMCKDLNIRLIVVPYTVKLDEIEDYIKKELKKL